MNCNQTRVFDSVFSKKSPITIWSADRFHGKTVCVREIALSAIMRNTTVFILDSNKRRSASNASYVYQNICQYVDVIRATDKTITTKTGNFYWFRPLTIGCKYTAGVDILIIMVRDDGCILNLEQYLNNIQYKQLVILGDTTNSEWMKRFCKKHWLDVIQ